jgi:hypothetical protein
MQKLILGVVLLAVVGGGVWYWKTQSDPASLVQEAMTGEKGKDDSIVASSLKDLLGLGKNVTCTVKSTDPENPGESTVYVSGKKMSGEFTTVTEGKTYSMAMISDGEYTYMWNTADKKGTKMKTIDPEEINASPLPKTENDTTNTPVDLEEKVDMSCVPWVVDGSKFTVPSDVVFTDLSEMLKQSEEMMKKYQGGTGTTPALSPALCDSIEDAESKAACLKSVSGN